MNRWYSKGVQEWVAGRSGWRVLKEKAEWHFLVVQWEDRSSFGSICRRNEVTEVVWIRESRKWRAEAGGIDTSFGSVWPTDLGKSGEGRRISNPILAGLGQVSLQRQRERYNVYSQNSVWSGIWDLPIQIAILFPRPSCTLCALVDFFPDPNSPRSTAFPLYWLLGPHPRKSNTTQRLILLFLSNFLLF